MSLAGAAQSSASVGGAGPGSSGGAKGTATATLYDAGLLPGQETMMLEAVLPSALTPIQEGGGSQGQQLVQ